MITTDITAEDGMTMITAEEDMSAMTEIVMTETTVAATMMTEAAAEEVNQ